MYRPQKEGSYRDRDSIINNSWEAWFNGAFELSEFNSANTLWMAYYASLPVGESGQDKIFKKVLQTLYTSLPEIIGVLFLMKGDAEEDDIRHCFGPLNEYYEKIQCKNREALKQVRGVHYNSEVFFSSRLFVLPFVEIRVAKQEDHDDLAAVFNSQSHTVTEIYGDYFLAELIAAQDETNKALTAQVKDQAIGLMALTSDLDVKLLHQCFELGLNDNLYKPEFMDAVNRRRELLLSEQRLQEKEAREEEQRKLKEATMRCNIISQRIALQEYLISKEQDIKERIEKVLKEQEEAKNLTRKDVEDMLDEFLEDFETPQASDYFFSNPSNDSDLCTNIQPKRDFLLSCLEIFGLPVSYMDGVGHFPNFGKKDNEKSAANVMKGLQKKKQKKKTPQVAKMIKGLKKQDKEEKAKLTHFDLEPALHAIKDFLQLNSEVRSQMRMDMKREADSIEAIFVDEHGERSFKQCVDIMSFEKILTSRNVPYSHAQGTTGKLLRCFGELAYQLKEVIKMPEKDPKEIAKELARKKAEKEEKGKEEKDGKKPRAPSIDEDSDEQKKQAPPQCINVKLYETSIHDMYQALEKSRDYDFTLETLGIVKTNLDEERVREGLKPLKGDNSDFENEKRDKNTSKQNEETIYSDDPEYNEVVKNLNDLETIPDPPPKARNAFAVTLFCIDSAFESRSRDFLSYAFDLFPDRDYLILTQPHTAPESTLLQKFTLVSKKPNNTFPHALYILHRDALLDIAMHVRRAVVDDLELINDLIAGLDNEKAIQEDVYNSVVNPDTKMQTYISKIASTLTGIFVTSKDVNLEYYRSHFHIQDSILLNEHDRRGHTRIIHSVVNPIYERSTRFCLKEILRLSGKTCLYFEISNFTVIPQIFQELINVRTRRFPRFLKRRLDIEALQHEKIEGQSDMDMGDRDPFDAEESAFALWFTTRRLLSEPKIVKNSRIVVVGASDTGVSFIEALLSVSYLRFTNIVLISPGGLPHHHFTDPHANLKAYSTSYTNEELKLLMLENRVKVINARKVDIDRSSKHIILHDGSIVPYDTLVLTMGLQEQTLNNIGNTSPGFALSQSGRDGKEVIDGLLSIDDPFLYHYLRADGPLVSMLCNRKKKNDVVIYGRTLDSYCCIQGLINRGVKPENVILVIPEPECHVEHDYDDAIEMNEDISFVNPEAFTDQTIRQKIHDRLISMGVTIYEHCRLQSIEKDDTNCLKSAIFKRLDVVEEDVEDLANNSRAMNEGEDNEDNLSAEGEEVHVVKKRGKRSELELYCKVLVTAGHRNVDPDVFNSIHNNRLVYNGRLIVDKNFQTTDMSIFAAGSLCEFSGRYASLSQGRSLRLDRYNGREMGSRLARSVLDIYDPAVSAASQDQSSQSEENLPSFFLPRGRGGMIPGGCWFYHICSTNPLKLQMTDENKNRGDLMCDNIEDGKGSLIKFTFTNVGLIDSVTFWGTEEIAVQSLWSFVGLHENYLNMLTSRFDNGVIKNVVEFLSENWAMALYHEWFGDFCLRMRQGIQGLADIQEILKKVFDESQNEAGITRERMHQLKKMMDQETSKMIVDETLEFIKANLNHLPMYFVPGEEFDYGTK